MRQTSRRMIRAEVAKGQKDLEALQEEFGDKLMDKVMEQLEPTISVMVATEVKKRVEAMTRLKSDAVSKKKKKPTLGAGFSITLPTGTDGRGRERQGRYGRDACQENGVQIHIQEYEIKEGQSIQVFALAVRLQSFMERVGPAPDGDMFMDADARATRNPVTVEYEHALSPVLRRSVLGAWSALH